MSGEQMDLLSSTPVSRRTDPETSHAAAREIAESGKRARHQHMVLRALRQYPGLTASELAVKSGEFDRYVAGRRLPELKAAGYCTKGESRVCTVTGCKAAPWWPSSTGEYLWLTQ